MTLEEAIKEQEDALADKWCPWSKELKASIRLGIEALKFFKDLKDRGALPADVKLPGETKG